MGLTCHLQISPVNSPMLAVYSDVIIGWYLNQNGSFWLPSTCNRKDYKTPFHRSGHN